MSKKNIKKLPVELKLEKKTRLYQGEISESQVFILVIRTMY